VVETLNKLQGELEKIMNQVQNGIRALQEPEQNSE
jgi:hypothetical protein